MKTYKNPILHIALFIVLLSVGCNSDVDWTLLFDGSV